MATADPILRTRAQWVNLLSDVVSPRVQEKIEEDEIWCKNVKNTLFE